MAENDSDPFENGEQETRGREGGHKSSKNKVSSKEKVKKPSSYPRKTRKRDEESPPTSPSARDRMDFRRDDVDLTSLEIISPTGSILHQQEALHRGKRLDWSFKVSLSAEKVPDPAIYTCEMCDLPILIYGRLIPCKHVFCLNCAKTTQEKKCPRCNDAFARIEQSALGTVFICTFGGGKQTPRGCKRTYLSPRDLNAHIQHRHKKSSSSSSSSHATAAATESSAVVAKSTHPSSNPTNHPTASSLPVNLDLSNLSNITDAQLKAAADILAATINAGKSALKPSDPPPQQDVLMPHQQQQQQQQQQQNPNYVAGNPGGAPYPGNAYPQPTPLMSNAQPPPSHAAAYNPAAGAPFPPQTSYHNPSNPVNMMPLNSGGHPAYFPAAPPMSGPPSSTYGGTPLTRGGGPPPPMMNQQNPYGK